VIQAFTSFAVALFCASVAHILAAFLLSLEKITYRFLHPVALVLLHFRALFFIFFPAINYLDYATQSTYLLFCLALWITAHTDAQTLLISRFVTLFLAPLGWLAAQSGLLLITPLESVIGALLGLITLGLTARLAYRWTGQESLGQGDIDLLIFIGAFLGPIGCWQTLLIGSITGSLFGIALLLMYGQKRARSNYHLEHF
jgi:prepilin signal peptidase PulO-like enzyme (type II secretory pathway)